VALGCATTGADGAEQEAGIDMRAVEQPLAGAIQGPTPGTDLPPIDLIEYGEIQVATFGLG